MNDPPDTVIRYGCALADVLHGFKVLEEKADPFERSLIFLLKTSYRQRLLHLIRDLPPEVGNEIFKKV